MNIYAQLNSNYTIRTVQHQGRPHLVVPVIMMVEGVHTGNLGPLFHSAAELGKIPDSWNGIPVVVRHPEQDGQNVSANSPQVIDSEIVGRVYNTHMDDGKLKAEVWLDEERIRTLHPTALAYIHQGRIMQVSVGVFTDNEPTEGEWNNEHYQAIAKNHRPDHLALLPGETGACSWEDGCGIRTNKKGGNEVKDENKPFVDGKTLMEAMKSLNKKGFIVSEITNNEQGYRTLVTAIQSKLDGMDNDFQTYFLQEVYEDHFIYEIRKRDEGTTLYKLTYQTNEDESIEFGSDPVEVRRDVKYVTMSFKRTKISSNNKDLKKEVKTMSELKNAPCPDRVNELINHKLTKYTEKDKEWLLTQEADVIEKMFPNEPEKEEVVIPQVNAKEALEVLKESIKKPEDFFKILPDEMQDSMRAGLALHQAQKEEKVQHILDNTEDVWKEEDLKAMNANTLDKVYSSIKVEVDYSLNSNNGKPINTNEEEILLPPGVVIKEEEK